MNKLSFIWYNQRDKFKLINLSIDAEQGVFRNIQEEKCAALLYQL